MPVSQNFTAPSFSLTAAMALDASTVVATFNYPVNVGSGVYTLTSAHGDTRTVMQGSAADPHQVLLHTNQPLTQDFWTLTYSGQTSSPSGAIVIPGSCPFWVGVGIAP